MPVNPNFISSSSSTLEELSVSPSTPSLKQPSVPKTHIILSPSKIDIIPSSFSTLQKLSVSPSTPSLQHLSIPKTPILPFSSSNLEELPFSPSAPLSSAFSSSPPHEPLDAPAVINSEWQCIRNFNSSLAQLRLEECVSCHERWFDLKLLNGVCKACRGSHLRKTFVFSKKQHGC